VAIVIGVVVVALVLAVAAGAIGREARRLDALPPRAVFDVDEAVAWLADRLPGDVTASISYDQLRALLELGVDHLAALGVAGQTTGEPVDHEVVVDEAATVAAVVEQADARGLGVTPHEARVVVAGLLAYLQAISAVGPEAEDG
jgi:hypothetical protein